MIAMFFGNSEFVFISFYKLLIDNKSTSKSKCVVIALLESFKLIKLKLGTGHGKTFEGGNFCGCKQNSLFTGKNLAFQI